MWTNGKDRVKRGQRRRPQRRQLTSIALPLAADSLSGGLISE